MGFHQVKVVNYPFCSGAVRQIWVKDARLRQHPPASGGERQLQASKRLSAPVPERATDIRRLHALRTAFDHARLARDGRSQRFANPRTMGRR